MMMLTGDLPLRGTSLSVPVPICIDKIGRLWSTATISISTFHCSNIRLVGVVVRGFPKSELDVSTRFKVWWSRFCVISSDNHSNFPKVTMAGWLSNLDPVVSTALVSVSFGGGHHIKSWLLGEPIVVGCSQNSENSLQTKCSGVVNTDAFDSFALHCQASSCWISCSLENKESQSFSSCS